MPSGQTSARSKPTWRARVRVAGADTYLGDYPTCAAAKAAEDDYRASAEYRRLHDEAERRKACTCPGGPWQWDGAHDPTCPVNRPATTSAKHRAASGV